MIGKIKEKEGNRMPLDARVLGARNWVAEKLEG